MKSYQELLGEARARVREINVKDALARHATGDTVFLDVREPNEYNLGKIAGAVTVGRSNLEKNVESTLERGKPVIIYCSSGNRSVFACETLTAMGYRDVQSMSGGFSAWIAEGGDVE